MATGIPGISDEILQQANAAISNLANDYTDNLSDIAKELKTLSGISSNTGLKRIRTIASDLRGEAGMFGYLLLTQIADRLCRYMDTPTPETEIIDLHIDAIRTIIADNLVGDGGLMGQDLIQGLDRIHMLIGEG